MFGGNLSSMEYGPVHSSILDSARYKNTTTKYWMDNITRPEPDNNISLKNYNIEYDELSDREIKVITQLYEKYKDFDFNDMKNLTHTFPEYEDPGKSSLPINIETILHSCKKSNKEIKAVEINAALNRTMSGFSC